MKKTLTLSLALAGITACANPPNVLMIAVDDLNDWIGCMGGHPQAITPNIDRLAGEGTLFLNAHCQAPICGPSRASLMTGLHPATTGIHHGRSPRIACGLSSVDRCFDTAITGRFNATVGCWWPIGIIHDRARTGHQRQEG